MESNSFVAVPPSAKALASILASLILCDIEHGGARVPPTPDLIGYGDGADVLATPQETLDRGTGSSADLVRLLGGSVGDAVGVVGAPMTGFHCFLVRGGAVFDPSVGRGYPAQSADFYQGAAMAPIKRPPLYQIGRVGPAGMVMEAFGPLVPQPQPITRALSPGGTSVSAISPVAIPPGVSASSPIVGMDVLLPDMRPVLDAARAELPAAAFARVHDAAHELMAIHTRASGGVGLHTALDAELSALEGSPAPAEGSDAETHLTNQLLALGSLHALMTRADQVETALRGGDRGLKAVLACAAAVINDLASVAEGEGTSPGPADEIVEDAEPRLFDTQDGEEPHALPFGGAANWLDRPRASYEIDPGCGGGCGSV